MAYLSSSGPDEALGQRARVGQVLKSREKGGFYLKRTTNPDEISFKDFENPWTFHALFSQEPAIWLTVVDGKWRFGRSRSDKMSA